MFCWFASKSFDHLTHLAIDFGPVTFKCGVAILLTKCDADLGYQRESDAVVNLVSKFFIVLFVKLIDLLVDNFNHLKSSLGYLNLGLSHGCPLATSSANAVAAEREACAKFIEHDYVRQFERPWRDDLSAAIRARGQP